MVGPPPYNRRVIAVWLNRISVVLAWLGVFIAGLLTWSHSKGTSLFCGASGGCDLVAAHPSSHFLNVPVAAFGLVAYLSLAFLAFWRAKIGIQNAQKFVLIGFGISAIGTLISAYLIYLSLNVIHAQCIWCIASAITMLLTFLVHVGMTQTDLSKAPEKTPETKLTIILALVSLGAVGLFAPTKKPVLASNLNLALNASPDSLGVDENHWRGPKDAPITIIEFADPFCPGCKFAYPTMEKIFSRANGKIRWGYQHYALFEKEGHEFSLMATSIAEMAAKEGKFWTYLDAVLRAPTEEVANATTLVNLAVTMGMDQDAIVKTLALDKNPFSAEVERQRKAADKLGISGTPTFIIFTKGESYQAGNYDGLVKCLKSPPYSSILGSGVMDDIK